ncbi:MAG TPA: iron-sulfur cluster insertion protein ErpA [Anaerolineae bacterium]|nr:iron-sulfur cluster insertion protein ErpA [Anaerolineae bacterium]
METQTMPVPVISDLPVAPETTPEIVELTPLAAEKLQAIMQEKNLTTHGLRVFIAGGGCSGFQYGMAFENQMEEGDFVFESKGVRLYVDQASAMYLEGAMVDYVDSLMGGGFRIENPNAVSTCSCGQSFSTQSGGAAHGDGCGHH